ncbi:hypothetical protein [Aeromonas sp. BIGb0445]|uniref:hypothetical protein n=1 Tax=Aeromonas sp. BIGb0445 TaxID=2940593 RepID=UPI002169DEF0|nr:hypothetical protein [Aeromonas sp. BIGb0445]MCS3459513.1 hypothetical protein [Aeromonas sp. BIGb0445]
MAWYLASLFVLLLTLPWWPLPNWSVAPVRQGDVQPAALERIERQHWLLAQTTAPAALTASNP